MPMKECQLDVRRNEGKAEFRQVGLSETLQADRGKLTYCDWVLGILRTNT